MSLNTAHSTDGRGVLIYNGEIILVYCKEVNVEFSHLNHTSTAAFKGKKRGPLYLTSHRVIFVNKDVKDRLLSVSMPFHCLRDVKLEQPVFGANYLQGSLLAQPGGNWEGDVVFRLTFNAGGCIDFGQAMLHAQELASRQQFYAAPPPYYAPPANYFVAPPAYYTAPQNAYYGFVAPHEAFPDAPPPGGVYMYDAPPPYPGIGPGQPQGPPVYGQGAASAPQQAKPPTYDDAIRHGQA